MRQLLLLRHAKSSWDDPRHSDHARPLNARGRRAAAGVADVMRELGQAPDLVLVSSARRTLQTMEALLPFDGGALVEPMDALYLATWQRLLEVLRTVPDTVRSVLLIGHNPGLHELAMALLGPANQDTPDAERLAAGYPTAALTEFAVAAAWRQIEPGGARLIRFLVPKDRAAGDLAESLA